MVSPEKQPQEPPREETEQEKLKLSADFFSRLIHQPDCVTKGTCNGCGRCEH